MHRISTTSLLKLAGLFVWACVGLGLAMTPLLREVTLTGSEALAWIVCYLAFGAAWWQVAEDLRVRESRRSDYLFLIAMTFSGLGLSYLSATGLGGILLIVVAGALPWLISLQRGVAWLIAQNIALVLIIHWSAQVDWSRSLIFGGLYLGYSSFTYVLSLVARRQSAARDEFRRVNSELRATQVLLAESTRVAERGRISRELHDLVGHHLTALSLNLEVASHLVEGKALEHVDQARSVAKLLLGDVREVVGSMRSDDAVNLSLALHSLVEGMPSPRIHLEMDDAVTVTDPRRAQMILRIAQEMITNSVKHAQADNLWLRIVQDEDGLTLHARDDGRGTDDVHKGNGLLGMTERLKQFGGELSIASSRGRGFSLNAWIPKEVHL